ncbi:MAG TPA: bifunctional nuclease family protein [Dehalococcoidia bacterium]|nr:bifunctional nuclease family protein [Dehalococcoidia bacterium]
MIEMTIDSVRIGLMNRQMEYQYVVLLREKGAERYLPIFIGPAEAKAILIKLKGESVPRPMTHDLLHSIVDTLGATIDSIVVSDLKSDIFYAKIIMNIDGGQTEVDARPSDALALAIRMDAPIFADESVLDKAGIPLEQDKETGEPILEEGDIARSSEGKGKKVSEEEITRLSAFRDFIDNLDLDDFGKHKS